MPSHSNSNSTNNNLNTKKSQPIYTSLYRTSPPPSALHLPTLAAVVAYGEYLEKDWTPSQALKWFKVEGDWTEASHWRCESTIGGRADGRLGRLIGRCIKPAQNLKGLDLNLPSIYLPPSLFQNLPNSINHLSLNNLSWRFNGSSLVPPICTSLNLLTSLCLSNLPALSTDALTLFLINNPNLQSIKFLNLNLIDNDRKLFLSDSITCLSDLRYLEFRNVCFTSPHGLFHLIHPSRNLNSLILSGSFPPSRHPRVPPPLNGADDTTSMPFRAYFMHFLPLFPHLIRLEIDNKVWGKERDGLGLVEVLGLGADVGPPSDWQRWEVEEAWRSNNNHYYENDCCIDEDREWVMAEGGKWVWVSDAEPMDDDDDHEHHHDNLVDEDEDTDGINVDSEDDDNVISDEIIENNDMLPPPASSALRRSTAKLFASLQESTTRSLEAAFAAPPAADGDLLRDGEAFCGVVLDRVEEEVRRMRDFVRRGGVRAGQQQRQIQQQQQNYVDNVSNGVSNLQVST